MGILFAYVWVIGLFAGGLLALIATAISLLIWFVQLMLGLAMMKGQYEYVVGLTFTSWVAYVFLIGLGAMLFTVAVYGGVHLFPMPESKGAAPGEEVMMWAMSVAFLVGLVPGLSWTFGSLASLIDLALCGVWIKMGTRKSGD